MAYHLKMSFTFLLFIVVDFQVIVLFYLLVLSMEIVFHEILIVVPLYFCLSMIIRNVFVSLYIRVHRVIIRVWQHSTLSVTLPMLNLSAFMRL